MDEIACLKERVLTLERELLKSIGDTRKCPKCREMFIPNDKTREYHLKVLNHENI